MKNPNEIHETTEKNIENIGRHEKQWKYVENIRKTWKICEDMGRYVKQ